VRPQLNPLKSAATIAHKVARSDHLVVAMKKVVDVIRGLRVVTNRKPALRKTQAEQVGTRMHQAVEAEAARNANAVAEDAVVEVAVGLVHRHPAEIRHATRKSQEHHASTTRKLDWSRTDRTPKLLF
jgi:hypothetical protein